MDFDIFFYYLFVENKYLASDLKWKIAWLYRGVSSIFGTYVINLAEISLVTYF